jgi:hypothetical protein
MWSRHDHDHAMRKCRRPTRGMCIPGWSQWPRGDSECRWNNNLTGVNSWPTKTGGQTGIFNLCLSSVYRFLHWSLSLSARNCAHIWNLKIELRGELPFHNCFWICRYILEYVPCQPCFSIARSTADSDICRGL